MTSLFELRWERPAAVLLASMDLINASHGDIGRILRLIASYDKGWVGVSALILIVDSSRRKSILDDVRRGLRPSRRLIEEASSVVKSLISQVS